MAHIECCFGIEADIRCEKCFKMFCKACIDLHVNSCKREILDLSLNFNNSKKMFELRVTTFEKGKRKFEVITVDLRDIKIIINTIKAIISREINGGVFVDE